MPLLSDIEFWKFTLPLIGAVGAWLINEARKRAWEEYERKEQHYQELIQSISGFYASTTESDRKALRSRFINQLNICWLYSPDEVIKAGYAFLESVQTDQKRSDSEKEEALGALILAIRKDLLTRRVVRTTRFKSTDFRKLSPTETLERSGPSL